MYLAPFGLTFSTITRAESGRPYNTGAYPNEPSPTFGAIPDGSAGASGAVRTEDPLLSRVIDITPLV